MTEALRVFHPESDGSLSSSVHQIQNRLRSKRGALASVTSISPTPPSRSALTAEIVADLAMAANHSSEPVATMASAMEAICKATKWPAAYGLLCMSNEGETYFASCGVRFVLDGTVSPAALGIDADTTHWPGIGLPGRLLLDQSMPRQGPLTALRDLARQSALRDSGIESVVALPIASDGRLYGAIKFFLPTSESLDAETLARLGDISKVIGAVFARRERTDAQQWELNHDRLTGLPNQAAFADRLNAMLRAQRPPELSAPSVVLVALDGFRLINDGLGREYGDELLLEVAARLRAIGAEWAATEPGAGHHAEPVLVARAGGAEFMIAAECTDPDESLARLADAIHARFRSPFRLNGSLRHVSCSIAICHSCTKTRDADHLLRDAQVALVRARECGAEATVVFDKALQDEAERALRFEVSMRSAIDGHELDLAYQPILDIEQDRVVGVEALVRWPQPDGSVVMPDAFIPMAEQCGAIGAMGSWVLRRACSNLADLKKATGSRDLFMSVNLSARQLLAPAFETELAEIVCDTGIDPGDLNFEVTESAALINPEAAAKMLASMRALGIKIYLDDFGAGFSSLRHLQILPLDGLKVDKDFVRNQSAACRNWSIVEAIMGMARALDLDVIAEGIETPGQLEILRGMQCKFGQGYLFSRPVTLENAASFVRSRT